MTFQRGFDITKAQQVEGPYNVISSSGPKSTHSEYKVEGPGVVIGRKGKLGTVFFSDRHYWPHDTTLWVKQFNGIDPKFAYYFLQTLNLERYDAGSSNPTLNRNHIHKLNVEIPPISTQRKIADILSAYDDLIENNTRRIAILEEMARRIYEEWFVHFRYPGHENVQLVESELGLIPERWEVRTVENSFEILGGGTPSKKEPSYWEDGNITWYSPTDLTTSGSMFMTESANQINEVGLKKSSAKLFPPYSVMMTSRATIGVVAVNTTEACTNQGFITCIPNDRVSKFEIYYWLLGIEDKIAALASGATYKEINKATFRTLKLPISPDDVGMHLKCTLSPIWSQIETLEGSNKILRSNRDLLLPRLMQT